MCFRSHLVSSANRTPESRCVDRSANHQPPSLRVVISGQLSVLSFQYSIFRLHPLKGEYKGYWAVTVRANWRAIFRFAERHVLEVDYVDYH